MRTKRCTGCGKSYPITRKYFVSDKRNRSNLGARCKKCVNKFSREYSQTEQGKASSKQRNQKYEQSRCGKECRKAYRQSPEGKATQKRYKQSPKGKVTNKKYDQSPKAKEHNKKYNKKRYGTLNGYLSCVFNAMNQRCNNSSHMGYKNYGGRGIQNKFTLDEFRKYAIKILNGGDPHGLQIDRIDNNGHYEPGNIRFVTCKVNNNNKRKKVA